MNDFHTRAVLAAALLLPAAVSAADQGQATAAVVEVQGVRDERDEKSYRKILQGMQVFDSNRQLAPGATLRFKVLPRRAGVSLQGLSLQLRGAHTSIAIPLDADMTFELPRDAAAAQDDAMLTSNRKAGSLTWRAEIRSPGTPAKTRRLGDLLLECKVGMVADLVAYVPSPLNVLITKLPDPCRTLPINMFYFTERPLFSVALMQGARRVVLPAAQLHGPDAPILTDLQDWYFLRDKAYMMQFKPLYEQGWLDDTLLQFDYMDDDPPGGAL
ncbi:hypothetical protein [Duganella sp. HH105]|uniref:hypothetical protein n=1 Tax=Duganella sp. HH105 TaxID=1781067 RepID=UPI000877D170|nr:hypothetical protein [Duganella sp. HH105]OEZ52437.1 hypothetical protein DUGA6_61550 [Duganella sp. HH105]